jgi:hypothetical protein
LSSARTPSSFWSCVNAGIVQDARSVIAGLAPAIHHLRIEMDARVKQLVDDFIAALGTDALADRILRDNRARLDGF